MRTSFSVIYRMITHAGIILSTLVADEWRLALVQGDEAGKWGLPKGHIEEGENLGTCSNPRIVRRNRNNNRQRGFPKFVENRKVYIVCSCFRTTG